ncbi:DUF481 domain-containing protein [uncultured Algimonas sp.]|uniref:DUF481 domain-containing protein n=1 Tax=uncultured Algimonas sp. TaxID=1547920 RepID=UPI00262362D0|nr:DUF481 domain-containing protein [uncultured Algimonas sp.]
MSRPITILTFLIVGMSSPALAKDAADPGWGGTIELNGSNTTGNNNTTNVGIRLKLKNRGADWRHNLATSADYGKARGRTNKERFRVDYKIGRDIGERSYLFANANYFSDDFGAFKNGAFLGSGYGYQVLETEPIMWKLEAGIGYRSQKARLKQKAPDDPINRKDSFTSARLFSDFEYDFSEAVALANDTEIFYSDVDTYLINETSVTSDLFGALAMRASFRVETHTDVPVGREKTDTVSRLGIVYTME